MMDRPDANESLERARAEYEKEIRLYELRHPEALSQTEATGHVEIAQSAVAKLEHAEDVSVSTRKICQGFFRYPQAPSNDSSNESLEAEVREMVIREWFREARGRVDKPVSRGEEVSDDHGGARSR